MGGKVGSGGGGGGIYPLVGGGLGAQGHLTYFLLLNNDTAYRIYTNKLSTQSNSSDIKYQPKIKK